MRDKWLMSAAFVAWICFVLIWVSLFGRGYFLVFVIGPTLCLMELAYICGFNSGALDTPIFLLQLFATWRLLMKSCDMECGKSRIIVYGIISAIYIMSFLILYLYWLMR